MIGVRSQRSTHRDESALRRVQPKDARRPYLRDPVYPAEALDAETGLGLWPVCGGGNVVAGEVVKLLTR